MIHVTRSRRISAPAASIFAALSDPNRLADLLPRVRRVEMLERNEARARLVTYMAFGPFGELRSEGEVSWTTNETIIFQSRKPVFVEARWTLTPQGEHTDVQANLALDLAPMLGPLAAFVPQDQVTQMIAPDLEAALDKLASRAAAPAHRTGSDSEG